MKKWPLWTCACLALCGQALASGYSDFNAGLGALNGGRADEAIQSLSRAITAPDIPHHLLDVAYFDRGTAYLGKGAYKEAIADFDKSLQLRPGWITAYLYRGSAYVGLLQFDTARADFSSAIATQPSIADGYLARAQAYLLEKKFDNAIADYSTIVSQEPDAAYPYLWRGAAYRAAGRYADALRDQNKAIDVDARSADNYFERGLTLREQLEFSRAIADFKTGLQHAPADILGRLNLGMTQWENDRSDDAAQTFRESLKQKPAVPYASLWLRIVTQGHGDPAADFARNVAQVDVGTWPGAVVSFFQGKATVPQVFAAAVQGDPYQAAAQHCEADFYLGEWHRLHGEMAEARALLDDAVRTCPTDNEELGASRIELQRMARP